MAHAVLDAIGLATWTWLIDLPAAGIVFVLVRSWGLAQSPGGRLLAMLHLGLLWYAIALALSGIDALLLHNGYAGLGLAPLHALTIGFCMSLLVAMVTRASCAHSARTLAADTLTWRLFLILQLAAISRVVVELGPGRSWLLVTIALWCVSLLPWCAKYAPVYWRPRADGRPG